MIFCAFGLIRAFAANPFGKNGFVFIQTDHNGSLEIRIAAFDFLAHIYAADAVVRGLNREAFAFAFAVSQVVRTHAWRRRSAKFRAWGW